ncbi:MAG: hypothetical protein AAGH15_27300, partial [Myxococcota bacterium]
VSLADRQLRDLLTAVREGASPGAILGSALDEAVAARDEAAVKRIREAAERLQPFPGDAALQARISATLEGWTPDAP